MALIEVGASSGIMPSGPGVMLGHFIPGSMAAANPAGLPDFRADWQAILESVGQDAGTTSHAGLRANAANQAADTVKDATAANAGPEPAEEVIQTSAIVQKNLLTRTTPARPETSRRVAGVPVRLSSDARAQKASAGANGNALTINPNESADVAVQSATSSQISVAPASALPSILPSVVSNPIAAKGMPSGSSQPVRSDEPAVQQFAQIDAFGPLQSPDAPASPQIVDRVLPQDSRLNAPAHVSDPVMTASTDAGGVATHCSESSPQEVPAHSAQSQPLIASPSVRPGESDGSPNKMNRMQQGTKVVATMPTRTSPPVPEPLEAPTLHADAAAEKNNSTGPAPRPQQQMFKAGERFSAPYRSPVPLPTEDRTQIQSRSAGNAVSVRLAPGEFSNTSPQDAAPPSGAATQRSAQSPAGPQPTTSHENAALPIASSQVTISARPTEPASPLVQPTLRVDLKDSPSGSAASVTVQTAAPLESRASQASIATSMPTRMASSFAQIDSRQTPSREERATPPPAAAQQTTAPSQTQSAAPPREKTAASAIHQSIESPTIPPHVQVAGNELAEIAPPANSVHAFGTETRSHIDTSPHTSPAVSGGDTFAALDAAGAAPTTTWVRTGARHAEAGYLDPALGWVGVRAATSGNTLHAAIVPGSTEAAQALGGHLAALNTFLADHHDQRAYVTMASPDQGQLNNEFNQAGQGSAQHHPLQTPQTDGLSTAETKNQNLMNSHSEPASRWTPAASGSRAGVHISVVA